METFDFYLMGYLQTESLILRNFGQLCQEEKYLNILRPLHDTVTSKNG